MSFVLSIRPAAEAEIQEAAFWYEQQRKGLGLEFLNDLSSTMAFIELAPLSFAKVGSRLRQVPMARFPYVIIYEVLNLREVVILAVFHTSRNPKLKP